MVGMVETMRPNESALQTGCSQSDFARERRQRQKAVIQASMPWPNAPHINLPFTPNFGADRRRGQNIQAR